MRLYDQAANIEQAVFKTLAEGKALTGDLGGRATNTEYTKAVIAVSYLCLCRIETNCFFLELELKKNECKIIDYLNKYY
jgi:hypothetical protein